MLFDMHIVLEINVNRSTPKIDPKSTVCMHGGLNNGCVCVYECMCVSAQKCKISFVFAPVPPKCIIRLVFASIALTTVFASCFCYILQPSGVIRDVFNEGLRTSRLA